MIRLAKLTDYGLVLMALMAREEGQALHTARDLASTSKLPVYTVSKLLKALQHQGLLVSHRGVKGGYSLAREAHSISIAEVITALEGSIALTECSTGVLGMCELERCCSIKTNQRVINEVVRGALEGVTLSDLIQPLKLITIKNGSGQHVPRIGFLSGRTQ